MNNGFYQSRLLIGMAFLMLMFTLTACNVSDKYKWRNRAVKHYDEFIPYDLLRPVNKMTLDEDLVEISGLTHIGNTRLACVEDETGNIYVLDDETGSIHEKIKFHKFGDYEGIAQVGEAYYIAKSNGKIYRWLNNERTKYETPLGVQNNVEGLCFDERNNRLLLVCKGLPSLGEEEAGDYRAIYAFDLDSNRLIEEPVYLINQSEVMDYVTEQWGTGEEIPKIMFKPSGLAINPIDDKLYIINYIGRILIVINQDNSIHTVLPLSIQYFSQPEGICFDAEGNMFISNEGGEDMGYILRYNLRPID